MAEIEREITVRLKWSLDEIKLFYVNKGIPLIESFILKDIYLIKNEIDIIKTSNLKLLSQAVILRECIGDEHDKKLVYKDKKYDDNGNIISSKKYSCPLIDMDKTYELLTHIGYKECFRYEQECLQYKYGDSNIFIEYIPELGLFLELENNNKNIDELIVELNGLNMPYYEDDYFVKKASLMIDEMKKEEKIKRGK